MFYGVLRVQVPHGLVLWGGGFCDTEIVPEHQKYLE